MGRVLLLLIIVFLLWLLFRGFFRAQTKTKDVAAAPARAEDMVACANCGVNLPRSEAREEGGRFFCQDNPRCLVVK